MYVWPKRAILGRAWLVVTVLAYVILALPLVAHAISETLPPSPSSGASTVRRLDALIVLAGDNEDGRVVETLETWQSFKPALVLLLGDEMFAQRVAEAGVPESRIRQNDGPLTTRAQMEWIGGEFRRHPVDAAAIIASRLQMPRVFELARTYRLHLIFLPSPLDHNSAQDGLRSLIPSYGALQVSRDALYERVALTYYRSRGWIAAEP
jgi:uncharacterized SAM-binding protein YcdF (DUF218 family)